MSFPFGRHGRGRTSSADLFTPTSLAMLSGALILVVAISAENGASAAKVTLEVMKELGVVLVSVFGVSIFYEKFIAERHFQTFHANLQNLIGRGETNAATCEALGILQIFKSRRELETAYPISAILNRLGANDYHRVIGRSLIFTIYGWQAFKPMLTKGASLELCMLVTKEEDVAMQRLSGFSLLESQFVIHRIRDSMIPWLETEKPEGSFEVRFHQFPLLDSLSETRDGNELRAVWDLNFGEGLASRQLFYLNGDGILGRNLRNTRYDILWDQSERVFRFEKGRVTLNELDKR